MKDCNLLNIHTPEDPLQAVLKQGAQQLLQQAIDIEPLALALPAKDHLAFEYLKGYNLSCGLLLLVVDLVGSIIRINLFPSQVIHQK